MAEDADILLIRRIANGERAAEHALYQRHIRYLTAVAARYISNDEDLRDVLQEALVKIFANLSSFQYRGAGSLRAWMSRIVLNDALRFLRDNSRLQFVELDHEATHIADPPPEAESVPADVIHRLIRELPDGYRTIFNLYLIENKSHKEIAKLLGIKESTSASQFHRAKVALAEKITNYLQHNRL